MPAQIDDREPQRPLYERQLEEILAQAEQRQTRPQPISAAQRLGQQLDPRRLSAAQLVVAGLVVAGLGLLVNSALPTLGGLLMILGIILFLSPLILSRPRSSGGSTTLSGEEKLWRGRPVRYDRDPPPLSDLFRRFKR